MSVYEDCLAFIEQLKDRLLGGRLKVWNETQTILMVDIILEPRWRIPSPKWELWLKPDEKEQSLCVLASGTPGPGRIFDRYGLQTPFVVDGIFRSGRDGGKFLHAPDLIKLDSPLTFSWDVLIKHALYCDKWGAPAPAQTPRIAGFSDVSILTN